MARKRIFKEDGKPTPFFWTDKDGKGMTEKTVFKKTSSGVKRMRGVHFDVRKNAFQKEG